MQNPNKTLTAASLQDAYLACVNTLSDHHIERACKEHITLWAAAEALSRGDVQLQVLGPRHEAVVREFAHDFGLVLVAQFEGISENFNFADDETPNPHARTYTPESGRAFLRSINMGDELDTIQEKMEFLQPVG